MGERRERDEARFHYHLYDVALGMYRYIHSDVWRGQKYYTSLNVAIITVGFGLVGALLKLQPLINSSLWLVIPIFVIGSITSLFGFVTLRTLRRSFLEAVWFKTVVEESLQPELVKIRDNAHVHGDRFLTPVYCLKEEDRHFALESPGQWIDCNIFRPWGIIFCFMLLQLVFFVINIIGISVVAWLATLSF